MRRRTGIIIAVVVGLFALFVPVIPNSEFPASLFCSYLCHSINCNSCGSSGGPPNVFGSLIYNFSGYGGVVLPNHTYQIVTQTDMAQYRLVLR